MLAVDIGIVSLQVGMHTEYATAIACNPPVCTWALIGTT
jgi:hypothetical protein